MYYIGIDISKFKHDCAVIDDLGEVITPSWSFTNDAEGFSQLKLLLDSLDAEIIMPDRACTLPVIMV